MSKLYLITGATGHVGTVLVSELLKRGENVRVLVRPGHGRHLPDGVEVVEGNITEEGSLVPFFDRKAYDRVTLLHCAALITVASRRNPHVWDVNVNGTENVMRQALAAGVERVVYVSSVHAIPERPEPEVITEVSSFSPDLVHGQYAKSKAAAAQKVLEYAAQGLNVSIVHPSGIIGPGDVHGRNHMIRTIRAIAAGTIPVALHGGYDFVDSRDVVQGILLCEERGRSGECYILNGHYITVSELLNTVRRMHGKKPRRTVVPHRVASLFAPVSERLSLLVGKKPPLFTPYSVYTLHTNGHFSHKKATDELGYSPRSMEESIRDSLSRRATAD
ncbi:MAG: NAD-dependent epimerase/dehydratase family protein [Oscillospiraceae bacterium]|nr:NAD-dependent epimerase/dehydratase family protein [Oscillospiraceae bacterium]